jgi:hypothetical protein
MSAVIRVMTGLRLGPLAALAFTPARQASPGLVPLSGERVAGFTGPGAAINAWPAAKRRF